MLGGAGAVVRRAQPPGRGGRHRPVGVGRSRSRARGRRRGAAPSSGCCACSGRRSTARPGATLANGLSFVALAVGLGGLTLLAWRRPLTAAGMAGAAVAIFLLVNKVYSPTYDLWLVVFFVLLPLPRREWLAFCAVDVAMFATVYGYFHWGVSGATVHQVLPILVAARSVVLVLFVVRAVRVPSRRAHGRSAGCRRAIGDRNRLATGGAQPSSVTKSMSCSTAATNGCSSCFQSCTDARIRRQNAPGSSTPSAAHTPVLPGRAARDLGPGGDAERRPGARPATRRRRACRSPGRAGRAPRRRGATPCSPRPGGRAARRGVGRARARTRAPRRRGDRRRRGARPRRPSTRRSSPHTFSTSSASWTPSTQMRLARATLAGAPTTARLPDAVRTPSATRPRSVVGVRRPGGAGTRWVAVPSTANAPGRFAEAAARGRCGRAARPRRRRGPPACP